MSFDPLTGEIWDFFGGQVDLNNRVLRATSDAFSEDPLRVLRGMQFACRFNLTVDAGTAAMSRSIASEYSTLARERVAEEFMKWAVKSPHPGRIAEYLQSTGLDRATSRKSKISSASRRIPNGTPKATSASTPCTS